ncbi:MAG TPA: TolC family protein [Bdellovibrionota bacterium]|jgi:outer membrane protein TolC
MRPFFSLLLAASLLLSPFAEAKSVALNPANLRQMVVYNNIGVLQSLNKVHQAKDRVMIARGNLLPRLDLGASIGALTGGPAFLLSAITVMLPFLVPANWANLHENASLLEAQKVSYRLVQLNQYASAYSLYATVLTDIGIREVVVAQYNDWVKVRNWLRDQQDFVGNVPQIDIDQAEAQVQTAYGDIAKMDELLLTEKSSLKEMLSLGMADTLTLDPQHTPASASESLSLDKVLAKVQAVSPEATQIQHLYKAAQAARWGKVFGFFNSAGMSIVSGGSALDHLGVAGGFSIGFDYVPNIQLANDNINEIRLRFQELKLQQQQLVEATVGSIAEAKRQITAYAEAERLREGVVQSEFVRYTLGLTDLLHVFEAERQVAQARATRLRAEFDLDALRITLHRALLTDQFSSIPGCRIRPEAEEKDRKWLGRLFNPSKYTISIDEACRPADQG